MHWRAVPQSYVDYQYQYLTRFAHHTNMLHAETHIDFRYVPEMQRSDNDLRWRAIPRYSVAISIALYRIERV